MATMTNDRRMVWLLVGLLAGIGLATIWPAEKAQAVATDSNDRFAIATVEVSAGNPEAVFVLDYATGKLVGGLINPQTGIFTNSYYRQLGNDFNLSSKGKARFAMVTGAGMTPSGQGVTVASGVLYVAEMSTAKVIAYRFPYRISREPLGEELPLEPFAFFSFRQQTGE